MPQYRVYIIGSVLVTTVYEITAASEADAIESARGSDENGEQDTDYTTWDHIPELDSAELSKD